MRAGMVVLSCVVGLILVELLLRAINPTMAYQFMPQLIVEDFFAESDHTEVALKKNYSGRFISTAAPFDSIVRTNRLGWRDDEPDSRPKVLVFGDSFVFGFGLSNGETIPDQLEKMSGGKVDFVNLGYAAGRSPDSYATYLRYHDNLKNLPTVLLIFNNDLKDTTKNEYFSSDGKRLNTFDESCYKVASRRIFIRGGRLMPKDSRLDHILPLSWIQFLKQSYTVALFRDRTSSLTQDTANEELNSDSSGRVDEAAFRTIAISIDSLKKNSNSLFLFTLGSKENEEDITPFYQRVLSYCQESGIPCKHIPKFSADHYWQRDAHYNQLGAKECARIIFESLPDSVRAPE